jgi:hypothetical protein
MKMSRADERAQRGAVRLPERQMWQRNRLVQSAMYRLRLRSAGTSP